MNPPILISVIICTHNPRAEYLNRVLQALSDQSLTKDVWELLLIDNASEKVLSQEVDISWHPQSRYIREDTLGLTPARLRGIQESVAEILVFVDDDNVLDPDYLESVLPIGKDYPLIGAWGGQIRPEFEEQPPEWTREHWEMLAIEEFDRDRWSNVRSAGTHPCGAGLCVRKVVAERYARLLHDNPLRLKLDRKGKSLVSCGDIDLAYTACDMNLGMGRFTKLKLIHLIPPNRLQEDYLLKIVEQISYSYIILNAFRDEMPVPKRTSVISKLLDLYSSWKFSRRDWLFIQARRRGESMAIQEIASYRERENATDIKSESATIEVS
jgi:glycosyltransferase involved in cell wall biosynthesis